jgi:hypothetical protein
VKLLKLETLVKLETRSIHHGRLCRIHGMRRTWLCRAGAPGGDRLPGVRPDVPSAILGLVEPRRETRILARLRYVGAGSLVVMAAVHLNLYWREDYRLIPTIGWLFLLTVIAAVLLALVMLVKPHFLLAGAAALFALGTLGSYAFALTQPLFGFEEPGISYSGGLAIASEGLAAIALGIWAWNAWATTASCGLAKRRHEARGQQNAP